MQAPPLWARAALFEPALVPEAAVIAAGLGVGASMRTLRVRRRRWRQLESEVRSQGEVAQRLAASLQDIVSELRLEDVLEKVTANASSTLSGRQFALLVDHGEGPRCRASAGLPDAATDLLERWVRETGRVADTAVLLEDLSDVPLLAELPLDEDTPLRSLCAAPLTYRGESLGVLAALSATSYSFLPRDVEVIQSFATQAAIALSNARLFEAQEDLASRDPLTGLLNHREFHETVARELDRCRRYGGRLSVALFDVDGFKAVNDLAGHAEGDRVLRLAADQLGAACRSSDMAFRIGGDEFALLLPETTAGDAGAVAERAAAQIAGLKGPVEVSFGVGVWPEDGPGKESLLGRADGRLYDMKRDHGRMQAPPSAPRVVLGMSASGGGWRWRAACRRASRRCSSLTRSRA